MTFLTIGRCEFDDPPERLDFDGNTLRMSGDIVAASAAEMIVRRQQVLGLIDNPDEDVFPVTFTEDPSIDGWYRVRNGGVGSRPTMFASYMIPWDLTLERLPGGSRSPQFEVYGDLALGTNSHSVTSATGVLGALTTAPSSWNSSGVTTASGFNGDDGAAAIIIAQSIGTSGSRGLWSRWTGVDPADHYANTPVIEVLRGGQWYPVIGRQVDEADGNWRIRNGFVTFTPTIGVTGGFTLTRSGGSPKAFRLGAHDSIGFAFGAFNFGLTDAVTILRNDPWAVIVRLRAAFYQLDVTLRAGAMFAEVTMRTGSTTEKWAVERNGVETTTTTTGGIKASSNDADGFTYVALCPAAVTADTTQRYVYTTSAASSAKFAVGLGTAAGGDDSPADLLDHFLVNVAARQRVVSR